MMHARACEMTGYGPGEILGLDLLATYVAGERELGRERMAQMPAAPTACSRRPIWVA